MLRLVSRSKAISGRSRCRYACIFAAIWIWKPARSRSRIWEADVDPRLLKLYNRELQHVREVGAEFAAEFPKIAARLGLDTFECADPYVERLFEGFAFMAARVQLKVDAEFPTFTQNLLEIVYPHYL